MSEVPGTSEGSRIPDFLQGGGEMGRRMRSYNWVNHPLGPPEGWPQSLKIIVRIMLTSRYAMWMGWGPELYFFCNDAYLPTVGIKESWFLGEPAKKVWAEIWNDIGPRIESVIKRGEATWDEALMLFLERSGYPEETYHTFSYSPLTDDFGSIGGMLCVVTEETDRVIDDRRLAMLRELAADLAASNTEEQIFAAVENRLSTDDKDIPFSLIYTFGSDSNVAELRSSQGIEKGNAIAPATLDLSSPDAIWPAQNILSKSNSILATDLAGKFDDIPTGSWNIPARQAVIVPLAQSGQERPAGFLIAGINPYRPFNTQYEGFINLLTGQIAAALSSARAYEQERKRAEALAELDRAKTTFFSNVSHEFRTPLTLMLGPLEEALSDSERMPQEDRQLIEVAHRNSLRLLKLVNSLLDFSRLEAGRIRAIYQPTDLALLTADLASVFRSAIERAGMKLVINCPPLSEPVYVDRDMWEKIVLNLISNAFKFTFEGEIDVSLKPAGDHVELTVRDTGTGIPVNEIPHLFERFHRVEGARGRTYEGTGIGLALVQELARLHGGSISVESLYGKGSTFMVSVPFGHAHLPADRVSSVPNLTSTTSGPNPYVEEALRWLPDGNGSSDAAQMAALQETPHQASDRSSNAPGTTPLVLLADDNADVRDYVRRLLSERFEVHAVSDGQQALDAARSRRPDLILTDVMMPRLDGFGLLRELRADQRLRDVPVIMLSARAGEEARIEGLQAGADDYLVKPFSARELMAHVTTRLELSRLRSRLQQERASIANLFAATPTPIATLNGPDLIFDMVNQAYSAVFPGRDLAGKPLLQAVPDLRGQGFDDLLRTVMRTGEPFVGREMLAKMDRWSTGQSEDTYWTFIYAPVPDDSGQNNSVIVIANEVTQEVRARNRLEFLAEIDFGITQLRDADIIGQTTVEKVAKHLDVSSCAISEIDTGASTYTILYDWRDDGRNYAGTYPLTDFISIDFVGAYRNGHAIVVNDISGDENTSPFVDSYKPFGVMAFASVPYRAEDHTEAVFSVSSSKPRVWGEDELQLLRDVFARVYPAIKRARVEAEREQLLASEQSARTAAEQANRLKDEFLATVSHELRTPLNAILGWANMLRSTKLNADTTAKALETIERNARAQNQIISDLLDVSRIISGKLRLDVRQVSLGSVIEEAIETVRPAAMAKDIQLQKIIDPLAGPVMGDPNRLQQVIWNLLSNAVKFTPRKGRIQIFLQRVNSHIEIIVSDNGQGIQREFLPHVFERFRQEDAKSTRKHGGLGLGLAIVRHLVELHGGMVRVESPGEGQGSIFTVTLPVAPVLRSAGADQRVHPTASDNLMIMDLPDLTNLRVLLVDDEEDARDLITAMLTKAGSEVKSASSSPEALELMKEWKPDVILSDIGMPEEDGYTFIRKVRTMDDGSAIPAAALTAYARVEDRLRALSAGYQSHIPKPVEPAELLTVVASMAGRLK